MLLRGITQGHPFYDGNKRTGFLLAAYYLELMGFPYPENINTESVISFCTGVSAGEIRDVTAITRELKNLWGVGL